MLRWLTTFIALLAIPSSLLTADESVVEQVVENEQSLLPTVLYPDTGKRSLVELSDALHLVELRGDPRSLQISGLDRITADQLQSALALDLEFQATARQTTSLVDFIDTLAARIKAGFLHSGFPHASIAVDFRAETDKIHVIVSEGKHFVNGDIRVSEVDELDVIELANAIRTPTENRPWVYSYGKPEKTTREDDSLKTPAWEVGAVTQFNEDSIRQQTTRIRELITDQGFPFARFKIKLVPEDDGKTSLLVEIADLGSQAKLSNVRFNGLQRHSEEQLLSHLAIDSGTALTGNVLRDIYSKLRESCRFWSYDVLVSLPSLDSRRYARDAGEVELVISLVEYPHVPPLGKPLSEAEETMRKAALWLENYFPKGDSKVGDLVIEVTENPHEGIEEPTGIYGKIILSPQQGASVDVHYSDDKSLDIWHSLVAEGATYTVFDWRQKKKLRVPLGESCAKVNIGWGPGEIVDSEYKNRLVTGFGLTSAELSPTKPAVICKVACEPVVYVNFLHRDGAKFDMKDDELRVQTTGLEFRIDKKTGRLLQVTVDNSNRTTNSTGTFSFQKNAFQEHMIQIRDQGALHVNCYDLNRPFTSCVGFAIRQLQEQPFIAREPLRRYFCEQLLHSMESGWIEEFASATPWSGLFLRESSLRLAEEYAVDFAIPSSNLERGEDILDNILALYCRIAVPLADRLFPRGSWPWTFTREMSLNFANSQDLDSIRKGSKTELDATMRSEHTGILAHALVALLWEEFNPSAFSKRIAMHAQSKINEASFVNDIHYFIRDDFWSAKIVTQLAETIDGLSDLEKSQFRESLSPFLATAFDSLIARRQSHPHEAAADALEGVLVELWRSDWRNMLSERLGNVTAKVQISEQP